VLAHLVVASKEGGSERDTDMTERPFILLDEGRVCHTTACTGAGRVRLSGATLQTTMGWELKAQGLCKDDRCIPTAGQPDLVADDGIDLQAFAALLGRPLALDTAEGVAYLGGSATERSAQLASLAAPDFTLPDITGRMHALSDYRGKKVLLVAYASW